jgi:beta-lactamase class A
MSDERGEAAASDGQNKAPLGEEFTLPGRIRVETLSFSGLMGIYADDLVGNQIMINVDEPFETASTIKSFILASLFAQVSRGEKSLSDQLTYTPGNFIDGSGVMRALEIGSVLSVKNLATLMIIVSDNVASNILIDYLGLERINADIAALGFANTRLHRKLGEDGWGPLGTTTPREYGRLFTLIAKDELIDPASSQAMLAIFKQQHYNSTLTNWLPHYYLDEDNFGGSGNQIYVASKSGSMKACRNDGGIVHTPYGRYILVIFTKNFSDKQYHKEHESYYYGGRVSRLMFDQYLALEGRFVL